MGDLVLFLVNQPRPMNFAQGSWLAQRHALAAAVGPDVAAMAAALDAVARKATTPS